MKKLLNKVFIKKREFSKYWVNEQSLSHWCSKTKPATNESKLKILSATKKYIEELSELYNEEMQKMKEEFNLDFNLK